MSNRWQRILIASDLHGHFVDRRAWKLFLKIVAGYQWDRIILNGDVLDFAQLMLADRQRLGGYQRDYFEPVSLLEEITFTKNVIFGPLRKAARRTRITMRLGNHEIRYLLVAENNPGAMVEILKAMRRARSVHLEDVLELAKFGIELSYEAEEVLGGVFTVLHGVKASKAAAKQNLLLHGSGTSGHTHRMNCHTEIQRGKLAGWWESGCLRTVKNIEYLPHGSRPDWSQGFLELHLDRRAGAFFCLPHFIINHETVFRGKPIFA